MSVRFHFIRSEMTFLTEKNSPRNKHQPFFFFFVSWERIKNMSCSRCPTTREEREKNSVGSPIFCSFLNFSFTHEGFTWHPEVQFFFSAAYFLPSLHFYVSLYISPRFGNSYGLSTIAFSCEWEIYLYQFLYRVCFTGSAKLFAML